MTKPKLLIFFTLLLGCENKSNNQEINMSEDSLKLVIKKGLSNKFSEGALYASYGGADKTYINDTLVDSTAESANDEKLYNADIKELRGGHLPFDSCRSFFSGDTLLIEFKEINAFPPSDKIKVKVINADWYVYFVKSNNEENLALPKSLVFKESVKKRGQEILGELAFTLLDSTNKRVYLFRGPFVCKVE